MIFIGKNHKGQIISIVSAKSKESAYAYWQGKGVLPHHEEVWDIEKERDNEELGYVTPILETYEREIDTWNSNGKVKYIVVK